MILRLCYNEIGKAVAQMKHLTDKQISIFTLAMHLIFIIAMKVLIYDYQDGLLVLTAFVLLLYFIFLLWSYRGRVIAKDVVRIYIGGVLVQAIITAGFGWLGLPAAGYLGELGLGSDFGLLFYGVLLAASCVLLLLINVVKLIIH